TATSSTGASPGCGTSPASSAVLAVEPSFGVACLVSRLDSRRGIHGFASARAVRARFGSRQGAGAIHPGHGGLLLPRLPGSGAGAEPQGARAASPAMEQALRRG